MEHSFTYSRNTQGRKLRMTVSFDLLAAGFGISSTQKSCCIYFEKQDLQIKMNRSDGALSGLKKGESDWLFFNKKVNNQQELIELIKRYE